LNDSVSNSIGVAGVRSFGRQTVWTTVNWATDQLGDNQLGDTFRSTGRHSFDYLGDSVGSVIYLQCGPNFWENKPIVIRFWI